jgi:hypothetical protein
MSGYQCSPRPARSISTATSGGPLGRGRAIRADRIVAVGPRRRLDVGSGAQPEELTDPRPHFAPRVGACDTGILPPALSP